MVIIALLFVTSDTIRWWLTVQSSETKPAWDWHVLPSEGSKARTPVLWSMICINRVELQEYWKPRVPSSLLSKQLGHAEHLMEAQKEQGDLYVWREEKPLFPQHWSTCLGWGQPLVWMGKQSQASVGAHIPWPSWVLVGGTAGVKHRVCPPLPTSPAVLEQHFWYYSGYTWQCCCG